MRPGRDYLIYLPPTRGFPKINNFKFQAGKGVQPVVSFRDGNTLQVRLAGAVCETVRVSFRGGGFTLRVAEADNIGQTLPPARLYAACPEFAADYQVDGRGELLPVISGREYVVYFPPTSAHPKLTGFSYRTTNPRVKVGADFGQDHTLKLKVTGPLCEQVDIRFKDGRKVKLQVGERDAVGSRGGLPRSAPGCR